MAWIFLAAGGQLVNAVVALIDKYIVSDERVLPQPFVYAFYSCLITGLWALLYFIGFVPGLSELGAPSFTNVKTPSIEVVGMSFLAAYTFFSALVSMYSALRLSDASIVMPIIGSIAALASLGMSYLFLESRLPENFTWAVMILAVGTMLVAQRLPERSVSLLVLHSGIFFALHYIAMKGLFLETSFDDGFFWSRIGLFAYALSLLMVPSYLEKIKGQTIQTTKRAGALVLLAKVLAGIAAFMLLKATDLGDVTVVQATDGLKFVFILILGIFFGKLLPASAGETETRPEDVIQKVLYVAVIVIGFFILFA